MDEDDNMFLSQRLSGGEDFPSINNNKNQSKLRTPSPRGRSPKPDLKPRPSKLLVESLSPKPHRSSLSFSNKNQRSDSQNSPQKELDQPALSRINFGQPMVIVSPSSEEAIEVDGGSMSIQRPSSRRSGRSSTNSSINTCSPSVSLENLVLNETQNGIDISTESREPSRTTSPAQKVPSSYQLSPSTNRKMSSPELPQSSRDRSCRNFERQSSYDETSPASNVESSSNKSSNQRTGETQSPDCIDRSIPPKVPPRPVRKHHIPSKEYQNDIEIAFESRTDISLSTEMMNQPSETNQACRNRSSNVRFSESPKQSRNPLEHQSSLQPTSEWRSQPRRTPSPKPRSVPASPITPSNVPVDIQELLARQIAAKNRLDVELKKDIQRLHSLRSAVQNMKDQLLAMEKLRKEVADLRSTCNRMTAEVDLINATSGVQPAPLGETSEDFYQNIYAGPNFRKSKHKSSSKSRNRRLVAAPGPAVPVEPDMNQPWECSLCTFRNHPQLNCCEQCDMHRLSRSNRSQGIISEGVKVIRRVLNSSPLASLNSSS